MQGPPDAVDDVSADDLDGPAPVRAALPAGAARPRRRRRAALVAAGSALVVAGGVALHSSATGDDAPPLDGSASASDLFPVLADEAHAEDFPDASLATALRLVPRTAHQVATVPAAVIWVAQDEDGGVCLLVRELAGSSSASGFGGARGSGGSGSSGGSCATAADIASTPLVLPSGTGVSAALAPPGQDTSGLVAAGFAELATESLRGRARDLPRGRAAGLWVDGATAGSIVEAAVDSTATRIVVVPSESHRGSASLPPVTADDLAPYAVVLACLQPSQVRVSLDGSAGGTPTECGGGSVARHLTGAGHQVRVRVDAPAGLVWAASVVACTGTPADPVC